MGYYVSWIGESQPHNKVENIGLRNLQVSFDSTKKNQLAFIVNNSYPYLDKSETQRLYEFLGEVLKDMDDSIHVKGITLTPDEITSLYKKHCQG